MRAVPKLGPLEAAVMDRLWSYGRAAAVREVLEDLQRDRRLAYTTVMTVMDNLYRKGLLTREPVGRAYLYSATRTREEHSADLMAEVLAGSADRASTLLHFVQSMPADELQRLREALQGPATPGEAQS